ncbi:MAG: hypothetical protein GY822_28910, partial [Deltaproteobacteria bacterium]|nr:hypothetical protein [Deltaproteobacteria bacterium]
AANQTIATGYGITVSINASNTVITLSGTATIAEYEEIIDYITYDNVNNAPNTTTRTINVVVNDGDINSNTSTTSITIIPVNDSIVVNRDETTTNEEIDAIFNVSTNDIDVDNPLNLDSLSIDTDPNNGSVSVNTTTGEITYTPNKDFFGKDSLIYKLCSTDGTCDTAYFVINVNNVIDNIIAVNDTTIVDEEVQVIFNLINNDIDVDLGIDTTSLSVITDPLNGT